ncbi:phosphatase PAP2 family protein [Halanaerocella petrolearia]
MKLIEEVINQDVRLFYFLHHKIRCEFLNWVMPWITHLGGAVFTLTFGVFLFFFGSSSLQQVGSEVLLSVLISGIVVQIIKRIVNRKRPYKILEQVKLVNAPFCQYSFPSGHTTAIFSLAVTIGFNFPDLSFISQFLATTVGISRAYLGVHYPSDIVIGAIIGIYSSSLIHGVIF